MEDLKTLKDYDFKKYKFLIVDGEPISHFYLQTLLKKVKVSAENLFFAENLAVGWDLYLSSKPDFVLMELYVPLGSSFQTSIGQLNNCSYASLMLSQKIKEHNPDVKIIAQTTQALFNDYEGSGIDSVIIKPFKAKDLYNSISQYVF